MSYADLCDAKLGLCRGNQNPWLKAMEQLALDPEFLEGTDLNLHYPVYSVLGTKFEIGRALYGVTVVDGVITNCTVMLVFYRIHYKPSNLPQDAVAAAQEHLRFYYDKVLAVDPGSIGRWQGEAKTLKETADLEVTVVSMDSVSGAISSIIVNTLPFIAYTCALILLFISLTYWRSSLYTPCPHF